jgi:hypothetical protein
MICVCAHGSDSHYIGYAGPGVCGGILTECLEKDCECSMFRQLLPITPSMPGRSGPWHHKEKESSHGT